MFIRIAGIELKPPLLQPLLFPDGGLHAHCEAPEGVYDESGVKKLLALAVEGSTQLVKWEDKAGVKGEQLMQVLVAKMQSEKSPDGKKITHYYFTFTLK